jgi:hypothetical protein
MARKQKLKVYRTPIGFHDAYVAAPSQKAALAAWGSDADLFARGVADVVTDPELTREPLENPGEVIKRLRGSADEQLAALPPDRPKKTTARPSSRDPGRRPNEEVPVLPKRVKAKPKSRPSRAALERAEQRLAALTERQRKEDEALAERERALERERRRLDSKHERDRRAAERAVEKERDEHADAIRRWVESQT